MNPKGPTNGAHSANPPPGDGNQTAISLPGLVNLAPHHYAMLSEESGIPHDLIAARGYRTVTKKRELEDLGFVPAQRRVPTLVLPIHSVGGVVVNHQSRPDSPRRGRDGNIVKYETPFDSQMVLDVPPSVHHHLDNPEVPLFVTEGIKKGDALACHSTEDSPFGVVALLGVWNWRGTNEHGGKAPVACWYSVALNGRLIYVVFDGDVMVKRQVWYALAVLKPFLESRGATVRLVYLPQTLNGQKCGVDDYLVAGHTVHDLRELSTAKLLSPPPVLDSLAEPRIPYAATEQGLVMHRQTPDGTFNVPLTNFTATICTDIVEDNGTERHRQIELEVRLGQRTSRFSVRANAFAGMTWIVEHLGTEAILMPGMMVKDHCRAAIQMLSDKIVHRTVYTHIGWRQLSDTWCFLHGGGAIGPDGPVDDVDVMLNDGLQRFVLPAPLPDEDAKKKGLRSSLGFLEVASDDISFPIYMSVWRAVLGAAPFSLYLVGPTGAGKSTLAALVQQHFGPEMDAQSLPGSWTSTANALGELQFLAKDALLTIDDFCPTGSQTDQQRLHRDADRVFRNQGNGTGRQRMRPDGGLQSPKQPRGLLLATGEDLPRGQSLQARLLVVDMQSQSLDWDVLSQCQVHAAEGIYAQALTGFIQWLAPQYDAIQELMKGDVLRLRQELQQAGHKRTADIAAHLLSGWDIFLTYAYKLGVITEEERQSYTQRGWQALATAAQAQADLQRSEDPVGRFFTVLRAVLSSGQAHLADRETNHIPTVDADHYGWRNAATRAPSTTVSSYVEPPLPEDWRPQGPRAGWLDADYFYLTPDATYSALVQMAREQGETFNLTQRTLWKRLAERGVLIRETEQRHYTVRISVNGMQKRVLKIKLSPYIDFSGQSGQSGQSGYKTNKDKELEDDHSWKPKNLSGQSGHVPTGEDDHFDHSENPVKPEWSSSSGSESHKNQKDIGDMTTLTTLTTQIYIPPKDSDAKTHILGPSKGCPQCLARRIDVIGVYQFCLACGHKWQMEKDNEA